MKIVDVNPASWGHKINFVDTANTVVGFDFEGSCCEQFGYSVSYEPHLHLDDKRELSDDELAPYLFKTDREPIRADDGEFDSGGAIAFLLTAPDKRDCYLTLYNSHNGYYSHGFTVDVGGKRTQQGIL